MTTITFDDIFHDFTKTSLWHNMLNTQEGTPFHREANVGEHTRMALAWYKNNQAAFKSNDTRKLTQLAILFHDVGKPPCEVKKESDSRGVYKSYAQHELRSARIFEDYACSNDLGLSVIEIRQIKWMIENHIPYGRGAKKMTEFRIDMTYALLGNIGIFRDLLLSDAAGRISDTPKIDMVIEWCNKELYEEYPIRTFDNLGRDEQFSLTARPGSKYGTYKKAYVLVGASGSGKSTYVQQFDNIHTYIFNLDTLRIEYYLDWNVKDEGIEFGELYSNAFRYCCDNDKAFDKFVLKRFLDYVRNGFDIVIDNTNLTIKSRRRWITLLRDNGYYIIGVEFLSSLSILKSRLDERSDRTMDFKIVEFQYNKTNSLRYGIEIDEIMIARNGN